MIDLALRRQFFAEEVQACAGLKTPALVAAFAKVEREKFLHPGPWTTKGEADIGGPPGRTPDDDPRHVYHNVVLAIDPARLLFNGQPSTLGAWIDALDLKPGAHVLHIGAGLGYYTAIIAHTVGPTGRVVGIEVDETLAAEAHANLHALPWVELRHGDASQPLGETFDAILVNAGATHPRTEWLDAVGVDGRLVLPLTVSMPPGSPLGKGFVVLLTRKGDTGEFAARAFNMVMIYSAHNVRDESMSQRLGKAFMRGGMPSFSRLRRDAHDEGPGCWLHGDRFCLSAT